MFNELKMGQARLINNTLIIGSDKFFDEWDKALGELIDHEPRDRPMYQVFGANETGMKLTKKFAEKHKEYLFKK